jgi:hypothetical protein
MTNRCPCGRRWDGLAEAHCGAEGCHQHFASLSAFEAHRRNGRCIEPALLRVGKGLREGEPVLESRESPRGVIWHSAKADPRWE